MSNLSRLEEIEQEFHRLSQEGAYAVALDLATREAHLFPDYAQQVVYMWRITTACRLHNSALALQLLTEAVAAGHWYSGLRDDPDLQLLHGLPEFEPLVETCEQRRASAIANAVPVLKTLQPPPYPLLLALHGAQSNVESFASHWSAAVSHGWFVGLPQSSQAYGPGAYSWNDWDWAAREVQEHYATLCAEYPVDPERAVLAGFSQGGGLAAHLALSGAIKVRGLILVGPFLSNVESLIPLLEARHARQLMAFIVGSQKDEYCCRIAQQLATLLPQYDIPCALEIYPDLEHSFPLAFESRLPYALNLMLQD